MGESNVTDSDAGDDGWVDIGDDFGAGDGTGADGEADGGAGFGTPGQPVLARGEHFAPAAPDVDDAGSDHQVTGGGEDGFDQVQVVGWAAADPDGAEAESLEFLSR